MSAIHLAAHIASAVQGPSDDRERRLVAAMRDFTFPQPGFTRSMWDIYEGFSLQFSLGCTLWAALGLLLARRAGPELLRPVLALYALGAALFLLNSAVYFILPPTTFLAVAFLCSAAAWLASRKA